MRLAIFVWEYPPRVVGGLGTYISEIAPRLAAMGAGVSVFTLNDGTLAEHEVRDGVDIYRPKVLNSEDVLPTIIAEDIRRWGAGTRFFADLTMSNILSADRLVNGLVRREHAAFDCVIVHDWLSIVGGVIAKRELSVPLVFHLHSTERGRSLGSGSKTVQDLERLGGERADRILTVSRSMAEELSAQGFPTRKISVVYNGVDPAKYDPSRVSAARAREVRAGYGVAPGDKMILFVGRIVAAKGVDRLVQAMVSVKKAVSGAKLVIVGTSEAQSAIQELVTTLKLEDTVRFRFEFLTEEERISHFAAADVCVFPSLYEPFGIVALEAMSMGKPVVVGARNTSGMKEFVVPTGPDRCGFHVDPYEPNDIARGIILALGDSDVGGEIGMNGRRLVIQRYDWDTVATRTLKLYEGVIEEGRRNGTS